MKPTFHLLPILVMAGLIGLTAQLAGCGQTGPLYLPKKPAATPVTKNSEAPGKPATPVQASPAAQ